MSGQIQRLSRLLPQANVSLLARNLAGESPAGLRPSRFFWSSISFKLVLIGVIALRNLGGSEPDNADFRKRINALGMLRSITQNVSVNGSTRDTATVEVAFL